MMSKSIGPIHWLMAVSTVCGGCYVETRPPAQPAQAVVYEPAQPAAAVTPAPAPVVVEAPPAPPPAPPAEPVPPPPSPEHVWVAGHHRWNGHVYVWERGRYERRPHGRARYVAGHWERRDRGHTWVDGHWE
jgi:WXXGXW repeat (2 copies)